VFPTGIARSSCHSTERSQELSPISLGCACSCAFAGLRAQRRRTQRSKRSTRTSFREATLEGGGGGGGEGAGGEVKSSERQYKNLFSKNVFYNPIVK
jgi:hypothetical protein